MEWSTVFERLVWSGTGALCSLGIAYVVVGKDLAYLKGSMKHVMEVVSEWMPMREKHAVMSNDLTNVKEDIRTLKVIANYRSNGEVPPYDTN